MPKRFPIIGALLLAGFAVAQPVYAADFYTLPISSTVAVLNLTIVPEPSTWLLLLTGAVGICMVALRRRRARMN